MRGGDTMTAGFVTATPKALAQYAEMGGHLDRFALCMALKGATVQLLSDDSPYWWAEADGLRLVFCVAHGHKLERGRFCLVGVQKAWPAHKRVAARVRAEGAT